MSLLTTIWDIVGDTLDQIDEKKAKKREMEERDKREKEEQEKRETAEQKKKEEEEMEKREKEVITRNKQKFSLNTCVERRASEGWRITPRLTAAKGMVIKTTENEITVLFTDGEISTYGYSPRSYMSARDLEPLYDQVNLQFRERLLDILPQALERKKKAIEEKEEENRKKSELNQKINDIVNVQLADLLV